MRTVRSVVLGLAICALLGCEGGPSAKEMAQAERKAKEAGVPWTREDAPPLPIAESEPAVQLLLDGMAASKSAGASGPGGGRRPFRAPGGVVGSIYYLLAGDRVDQARDELAGLDGALARYRSASTATALVSRRDLDAISWLEFSELGPLREAIRTLMLSAVVLAAVGESEASLADIEASVRLIGLISKEPFAIHDLARDATVSLVATEAARAAQWQADNPEYLRRLRKILQSIPEPVPLERIYTIEAYFGVAALRNLPPGFDLGPTDDPTRAPLPKKPDSIQRDGWPQGARERAFLVAHLAYWTELLASIGSEAPGVAERRALEAARKAPGGDPRFIEENTFHFDGLGQARRRSEVQWRLAQAAIDAALARVERGAWPQAVSHDDPFGEGKLRIRNEVGGVRIWSIGPDEVDNAGDETRGGEEGQPMDLVLVFSPQSRSR